MAHLLAPSLLAADFANLQRDVELVNASEAHRFHLDVMDGVFVPNISFGMPVMEAIARHAQKPLDVHLMIVDPDHYIQTFADLGADVLTVHAEACNHLHRTLGAIRAAGMKAGVALNPHTPIEVIRDVATELDLVCLMSVNPGFGGQSFIERTYAKTQALRTLLNEEGASEVLIEIDGGVGTGNAQALVEAGANVLVAGSSVFRAENPMQAAHALAHF
jgi:ribulose-phosphate 3-epimerase